MDEFFVSSIFLLPRFSNLWFSKLFVPSPCFPLLLFYTHCFRSVLKPFTTFKDHTQSNLDLALRSHRPNAFSSIHHGATPLSPRPRPRYRSPLLHVAWAADSCTARCHSYIYKLSGPFEVLRSRYAKPGGGRGYVSDEQ